MEAGAVIDLRSDTVTRPTPPMLEAMMTARVGDDVYGEDETVNALQQKAADLFGMEAALFCPTGTMSNQIAVKIHTQPGDEVICDRLAHMYLYEGGGMAFNSGVSTRTLSGERGRFSADAVRENLNAREDPHLPLTRLVAVENTVNRGGGCCWELSELRRIREVCLAHGLALHLDGARLFNAIVARHESAADYGAVADTISFCISKGLGAPVGSLLLGGHAHIRQAHRVRKVLGGSLRQAGYLAAAGIYALDHHVQRLRLDHAKAKEAAAELARCSYVAEVMPTETNIVVFRLRGEVGVEEFQAHLRQHSIRALCIAPQTMRFVFHLDVSDAQLTSALRTLKSFRPPER